MLSRHKFLSSLALVLVASSASASPIVYVVNGSRQFGTMDLGTGVFHQIGPPGPDGQSGLVRTPNGSLLTLAFSGNLDSIDPATGVTSVIGRTGLESCMSDSSPCGPTSAAALGELGGIVYATDFSNNLYTVDPPTGAATLVGGTGIPPFAFNPTIPIHDQTFYGFDYSLFSAGGKLYETFDVITIDFSSLTITPVISAKLYQIDPSTAVSTLIAPTALGLTSVVNISGTLYAFNGAQQVVTLDVSNGKTTPISSFNPAAGLILGASPVPEPASRALTAIGVFAIYIVRRRRHP
jgi:hypothetical protein